jgi:glucose repression regulatory protein TUP1
LIRQSLYDLESTQVKLRDQYEAEITRLRRELDSRPAISPGAAPTATTAPGPAPIAPDRGVGGVPSFMPTPPGAGPGLNGGPERERERGGERERERERDGDRERESYRYEDKVAKKEARTFSVPHRRTPQLIITASPQPSAPSPQAMLSDLDPENVSRELKKEGSDWFAVWSSQTKRVLDVGLVHTFVHERFVIHSNAH